MQMLKNIQFFLIINFIVGLSVIALYAMEEQQHPVTRKGVPSLTYLATDAYIKSMKKDGESNQEISNAIKQELDEKCPLITTEVQDIINDRLSKDDVYVQQALGEPVIATLPELGLVVTQGWYGATINFWTRHTHKNHNSYGVAAGIASSFSTAPYLKQILTAKSIMGDGQWYKVNTFEVPENFELGLINNNLLIFGVKTESDDDAFDFGTITKLALFVRDGNNWELRKVFAAEPEHHIVTYTYSEQDDSLAYGLEDGTVVFWRYDKKLDQWKKSETIAYKKNNQKEISEQEAAGNVLLSAPYKLENIFFLQQPYKEHPLCLLHHSKPNDDQQMMSDEDTLSLWCFNGKKWIFLEKVVEGYQFRICEIDGKHLQVQYYQYYDPEYAKTVIIKEAGNRELLYVKEEFDLHRYFSADGSLYALKEDSIEKHSSTFTIKIFNSTINELIRVIQLRNWKAECLHFIDNKTIVLSSGMIISLNCSTNFALCKQVLQQAREKENVDFDELLESPIVEQLPSIEKTKVLAEVEQLKSEQSLKAKIERFRRSCKTWARQHELQFLGINLGLGYGLAGLEGYLCSKFGLISPEFLKNHPFIIGGGLGVATLPALFAFNKLLFLF